MSCYYEQLVEVNQVMNLTAITEETDVYWKHFFDSITPMFYIDLKDKVIADIGSGAGFPGVVLAIMCPGVKVVIIDSLNKRVDFLNNLVARLELTNVKCYHGRAEEMAHEDYREQFDFVFARAVARLPMLLELCSGFVKVGGQFVAMKAAQSSVELTESKRAQSELCLSFSRAENLVLPNGESRSILFFSKSKKLSSKYPRQFGKIKNKPL